MDAHLIQVPLDMRALAGWVRDRGLARAVRFDTGYVLHLLLGGMFGPAALQPFRLFAPAAGRLAGLYAYADLNGDELRDLAAAVATPDSLAVLDPARVQSKQMPTRFREGQRLGFDLRVRPVRRLGREVADPQSAKVFAPGAEVDAFRLDELLLGPAQARHREGVYADWLRERCGEAARLESCRLSAFRRSRAARGDGRGPDGPDATLHGALTVSDPVAFLRLVRRGIGRHRAYGYGMMLLRPPGRPLADVRIPAPAGVATVKRYW